MEFETLKKDYRKKLVVVISLLVLFVSVIALVGTRAKFKTTDHVTVMKGTIHFSSTDIHIKEINIQNADKSGYDLVSSLSNVPGFYELNLSRSYCTTNGSTDIKDKDETAEIKYENGQISIGTYTTKTKCWVYLDKMHTALESILANNGGKETILAKVDPDFRTTANYGMFAAEDDFTATTGEKSYYFRGDINNNWVNFAGFYWRIIRINGNGSIRLIYNGTSTNQTGEGTQIGTSKFNNYINSNAILGYMYGSTESNDFAEMNANINDSIAKKTLDNWYKSNLTSYTSYLDGNAGFCSNRQFSTSYTSSGQPIYSYATLRFYKPNLKCPLENDFFTLKGSINGNKALKYPIGLITVDEAWYAGGIPGANKQYYLYTGQLNWTMSPHSLTVDSPDIESPRFYPYVAVFWDDGGVGSANWSNGVAGTWGLRPVINLKADTVFTGTGTAKDPYIVKY